jgi:hypothetical protein
MIKIEYVAEMKRRINPIEEGSTNPAKPSLPKKAIQYMS